MKAMVLQTPGTPLQQLERPVPKPGDGQILLKVAACGVCRTDLHVVDGDLPDIPCPVVPGHEIVGTVYVRARYDVAGRIVPYLGILAAVMLLSLGAATLMSNRLHRGITVPIRGVIDVARNVLDKRDYSARAPKGLATIVRDIRIRQ